MSSACEVHFKGLCTRIDTATRDRWPEALVSDLNPFDWARSHRTELAARRAALEKEANELWLNGRVAEFKKISTEWGRLTLEIMKQFAGYVRQQEAV